MVNRNTEKTVDSYFLPLFRHSKDIVNINNSYLLDISKEKKFTLDVYNTKLLIEAIATEEKSDWTINFYGEVKRV